jgi:HlyD family secretion protein
MTRKTETGLPMTYFTTSAPSRIFFASAVAGLLALFASPTLAADDPEVAPKGAAVTVLKAAKSCFANIVEVSGTIIPREETQVRPERMGLKVAEVLADAGDSVTAGQVLARLTLPEGGTVTVQTPVAGTISASTASVGAMASGKGEALFSVIARSEFDLVGLVPTRDIARLAVNQTARIKIIGVGEVDGKVRRLSPTVQPDSQLGQAFIGITTNRRLLVNSSARAMITTGQSCGLSVPLTAILYGSAGTVVQVVRRARVETRRVETGLMSGGQVEIREGSQLVEGDIVVARAGALLREGDPVRPVGAGDVK